MGILSNIEPKEVFPLLRRIKYGTKKYLSTKKISDFV